ncbi:MAG: Proteasome subunit beta type-1 [Marteilia pararefringens]
MMDESKPKREPVTLGTTIGAIMCADGIVLAADSRTSAGPLIATEGTDKIVELSNNCILLKCGNAAVSNMMRDMCMTQMKLFERVNGEPMPIKGIAHILSKILYKYQRILESAFIICGYDRHSGYQIYSLKAGSFFPANVISKGSGSIFIIESMQEFFTGKNTTEETLPFMKKCILQAVNCDSSSGGVVNLKILRKDGITRCEIIDPSIRLDTSASSRVY